MTENSSNISSINYPRVSTSLQNLETANCPEALSGQGNQGKLREFYAIDLSFWNILILKI